MSTVEYSAQFLDGTVFFSIEEVVRVTGLSAGELAELAERGVLHHTGGGQYAAQVVSLGRRAARLRDAFELDIAGLALTISLLERIEALEIRLRALDSQLPR